MPSEPKGIDPYQNAIPSYPEESPLSDHIQPIVDEPLLKRFYELKAHANKVVRPLHVGEIFRYPILDDLVHKATKPPTAQELNQYMIDRLQRAQELFYQLDATYGIPVPSISYVRLSEAPLANDDATVAAVTDRVHGQSLELIPPEQMSEPLLQAIAAHALNMIRYYGDTFRDGGDYLNDIAHLVTENEDPIDEEDERKSQYVWGYRKDEEEKRLYLVDIEPRFRTYQKGNNFSLSYLVSDCALLGEDLLTVYARGGKHPALPRPIKELGDLIRSMLNPNLRIYEADVFLLDAGRILEESANDVTSQT